MKKKGKSWEKVIEFYPAYDKRHPNSKKNYGIGSVQIKFILKKDNKAVQFLFGTDWYLPETIKEYREKGNDMLPAPIILRGEKDCGIDGWDIGYHSPKATYKGQKSLKCHYIKGRCYYDGSGLDADNNKEILIRKGSEGVWKFLEGYWKVTFATLKKVEK